VTFRPFTSVVALALVTVSCSSPARLIRPVIHALEEDKYQAMKSAPIIVLAEILNAGPASEVRNVEKPSGIGGPMAPTIPMILMRISARVVFGLRGNEQGEIQFYSWRFAGGMHGGPRLFDVWPGSNHILFLRREGDYLHTVGDYPNYDVEISKDARHGKQVLPTIIAGLRPNSLNASDLLERIATAQIKAELENVDCFCESFGFETSTLAGLTSPLYVATVLDSFCHAFPNPFGRFAACEATAGEFAGRCDAYHFAREAGSTAMSAANLAEQRRYCEADEPSFLDKLRARQWPLTQFDYGWRETTERRRMDVRIFASAMDPTFRAEACEIAATMPEARDIPECAGSETRP